MTKAKKKKKVAKLSTYKVGYYFDGFGEQLIRAKSIKEARDKFFSGDFTSEEEWGENYVPETIDKVE